MRGSASSTPSGPVSVDRPKVGQLRFPERARWVPNKKSHEWIASTRSTPNPVKASWLSDKYSVREVAVKSDPKTDRVLIIRRRPSLGNRRPKKSFLSEGLARDLREPERDPNDSEPSGISGEFPSGQEKAAPRSPQGRLPGKSLRRHFSAPARIGAGDSVSSLRPPQDRRTLPTSIRSWSKQRPQDPAGRDDGHRQEPPPRILFSIIPPIAHSRSSIRSFNSAIASSTDPTR